MLTKEQYGNTIKQTLEYFKKAGIFITEEEKNNIEVVDFGLGRNDNFGVQLLTYINTDRVCAKEMVMFPNQIIPEHRHPPLDGGLGKEEIFRVRWGKAYLFVAGEKQSVIHERIPEDKKDCFTVWHEIELNTGAMYVMKQNTKHWFQGGPEGAVVSEFATKNVEEADIFTDPEVKRIAE